jgi:hypothetical protein
MKKESINMKRTNTPYTHVLFLSTITWSKPTVSIAVNIAADQPSPVASSKNVNIELKILS